VRILANGLAEFDVHIDQKQHSEEGQTAHAGEYDGKNVEEEANRIARWVEWGSTGGQ
jgi:hypothetical protein